MHWTFFIHGYFLSVEISARKCVISDSRYCFFAVSFRPSISLTKKWAAIICLSTNHRQILHWNFSQIKWAIQDTWSDMPFLSFCWCWLYIRFSTSLHSWKKSRLIKICKSAFHKLTYFLSIFLTTARIPFFPYIISIVFYCFFTVASMLRFHRKIHIQV